MPRAPTTDGVRGLYERIADRYDRAAAFGERLLRVGAGRRWIGERASGDVLEIGVGTGLNLASYPPGVRLTGIDVSPSMLAHARRRADELGRTVDLDVGDAQALDFPDNRFDTVVFSLCLCSIPDDRRSVSEGARVLKPGGRMLLLEHVASPNRLVRAGQRLVEPLALRAQADHLTREPLDHVRALGLVPVEVHRWAWGIMERIEARKSAPTAEG